MSGDDSNLSCSFCGKSQREVRKLIAGPMVNICDGCTRLCYDILPAEVSGLGELDVETLVATARYFADFAGACDSAVELLRSVAERARALPKEVEVRVGQRDPNASEGRGDRCSPLSGVVAPVPAAVPIAPDTASSSGADANRSCSFCGKLQREVRRLFAGPRVQICDECTRLCYDVIAEAISGVPATLRAEALVGAARDFRDSKTCDLAIQLLRSDAERARSLAREIEARMGRQGPDPDGIPGKAEGRREPEKP